MSNQILLTIGKTYGIYTVKEFKPSQKEGKNHLTKCILCRSEQWKTTQQITTNNKACKCNYVMPSPEEVKNSKLDKELEQLGSYNNPQGEY